MLQWWQKPLVACGFSCFVICCSLIIGLFVWELPSRLEGHDSVVVEYDDGQPAHVFLSEDDKWRVAVKLEDVDPKYIAALKRFEDKRFDSHLGVDPIAILRALWLNVSLGRRTSGASTLTMQLVRVLEPRPRTLRSKIVEAYRATQIELHLSKREILEAYLRFAPYGRNIEGVEAASLSYFGHTAKHLTAEEIATLLAVPQNPNRRYPNAKNRERLRSARDRIAHWLLEERVFDADGADALQRALESPVPNQLTSFPRDIPHFAYWLRQREPKTYRFRTTIDRGTQAIVERIVSSHEEPSVRRGIHNATAVVVDHHTGDLKAVVGNFRFSKDHGGQIAGFDVYRSPGSLLKPFIVAAAIDAGVAIPDSLVLDIPTSYGAYAPRNYDQNFRGLVRLDDALAKSLNIPFVRLLKELSVDSLTSMLRDMGAKKVSSDPGHYGLSAAVGSVMVSPLEVAHFYATLASGGETVDVRILRDVEVDPDRLRVMSPGAAWLTRKALRINDRPGFNRRRMNPNATSVFWKTGTSYGFRDAWAAGASSSMTAVVWLGNFSNVGARGLLGSERAGPILFDVLESLELERSHSDPATDDLIEVELCAYSGALPTDACEHTRTAQALSSHAPTEKCRHHVHVDIERTTGRALTPSCRAGREYDTKIFLRWPASVRRYLNDRHRFAPKIPLLADDCRPQTQTPPKILSPLPQTIALIPGVPTTRQEVPLEAETEVSGLKLSWFVDGEFIGEGSSEDRLWWTPSRGTHEVLVMDGSGAASKRMVVVR